MTQAYGHREQTVPHDETAEAATASLEAARVRAALADLTTKQREAVELAFLGGYTHTEVAAMLDLPIGTAKTRIRDGLIRLRDALGVGEVAASMSDIHALSGAYAVDALDDDERVEFEEHLAVCAECRAEVASFRETGALIAETEAVEPPASLRAGVLVRDQPDPPAPARDDARRRSGSSRSVRRAVRRRLLPQLLAAAAAVVLLAAGAVLWHPWQQHDGTDLATQILNAPDAMRVTENLPGGQGELTLVRSASLKRAVMIGDHVPAAGSGKTYQMWYQQPGQPMVSAGLMTDTDEPTVLSGDAATAVAAAVSVEPAGGSKEPTTKPVALFPLQAGASGNEGT